MFQTAQPRLMQRGDEHACRNPHAFGNVVILIARAILGEAVTLGKDHNQPGRFGQVGFVDAGADGLQRGEPFIAGLEMATKCHGW